MRAPVRRATPVLRPARWEAGGCFTVAPEGLVESRQAYLEDTGVLVTELRSNTGLVRVTDALLLRAVDLREDLAAHRGELLRKVEVLQGLGGPRNWDYRYVWIRDAAFSVYALRRIGMGSEAFGFLGWVLEAVERHGRPRVLYDLEGRLPPPEFIDPELEGYRGSSPVRWGNAAADQRQHDVFGEILDCAYQWASGAGTIDAALWSRLAALADAAAREWRTPDHGIWEFRTAGRPFTYSAALCHVALDRAARLAHALRLPGDIEKWRTCARDIARAIHEESWDPKEESLTEHLGGGGLDASLLALPLRRVLPAEAPRMKATTEAIRRHLGAGNGLLYRYLPRESPDGLAGEEGAFLLCSFWLVDNLTLQGRLDEAMALYDSLCQRAGTLGLLPEQVDPSTGEFLGNHPQAFSHVGLISSGVLLDRTLRGEHFRTMSTDAVW